MAGFLGAIREFFDQASGGQPSFVEARPPDAATSIALSGKRRLKAGSCLPSRHARHTRADQTLQAEETLVINFLPTLYDAMRHYLSSACFRLPSAIKCKTCARDSSIAQFHLCL